MKRSGFLLLLGSLLLTDISASLAADAPALKVLIIDGQNNHRNMVEGTQMMKAYLEETGLFAVDIATTPAAGKEMAAFDPDFGSYNVVLMNYNGDTWSDKTKRAFENFVQQGGGVVVVHAADNAFPEWEAYNKMIGLGGWGDRSEKSGPYVYYNEEKGEFVKDGSPGPGGSHGHQHEFVVKTRNARHPIMKGLPDEWLHQKDELYDRLRGPAENLDILATAFSPVELKGSGRHEPVLMTATYGKGRIFHTTLGHETYSQKCIGFIVTLQRGAEWVATGKVKQKIPADFPTKTIGKSRN